MYLDEDHRPMSANGLRAPVSTITSAPSTSIFIKDGGGASPAAIMLSIARTLT
jgi:hypothetical protein